MIHVHWTGPFPKHDLWRFDYRLVIVQIIVLFKHSNLEMLASSIKQPKRHTNIHEPSCCRRSCALCMHTWANPIRTGLCQKANSLKVVSVDHAVSTELWNKSSLSLADPVKEHALTILGRKCPNGKWQALKFGIAERTNSCHFSLSLRAENRLKFKAANFWKYLCLCKDTI